ncbi:HalOD1 output domain-containing protein [Haladaptatus caseinilyticus]|uniref:HalOD1 output domain-containing protein n=1 Tax=Haladaptatus caseinilyticus TaxID=2993314 RepID=UPI00224B5425|nr:HalOD1 output domain-containing protein [Haladaptatus caseinilyticus]
MTGPEDFPIPDAQPTSGMQPLNGTEPIETTVINRILQHENTDPEDLVPLYEVIDPEALNLLFAPRRDGSSRSTAGTVRFQYCGYQVTVTSDHDVRLDPLTDE